MRPPGGLPAHPAEHPIQVSDSNPVKKILIVDDSSTMRRIIMRSLRQAGLQVETILEAEDGAQGLETLKANSDIELVFSDVNMPNMNGLELVKGIRASSSKVPVVMISSEGSEGFVQQAMDNGANAYITKPFTPESIKQRLEMILG